MTDARTTAIRGRLPCRTCLDAMAARTASDSVGAEVSVDTECPCVLSVAIMRELGMLNAASMHDLAAGEGSGSPGVHEVELHMGDEEGRLFPVLRRVASGLEAIGSAVRANKLCRDVATLEAQHGEIRRLYLANGLVPPASVLGPHGAAEDRIVSEYADLIRLEWEHMRAGQSERGIA